MTENINALDEIHKGSCMGMDALNILMEKVEEKNLKQEMKNEYAEYKKIAKRIKQIYQKYDDDKPHETSFMNKVMTESMLDMKTLTDTSNSKIAEMLLQGVNMGIIEGRKILNKKQINDEVYNLVKEYVTMQETNVENLKKYL